MNVSHIISFQKVLVNHVEEPVSRLIVQHLHVCELLCVMRNLSKKKKKKHFAFLTKTNVLCQPDKSAKESFTIYWAFLNDMF